MLSERKRHGNLQRTERSMMRAICGVQLKDRNRSKDLMLMLDLNETIDQLAMANSVHWYGHVFFVFSMSLIDLLM